VTENITLDEIPVELMHGLPSYTITLVGYREDETTEHCGCGTLVTCGNDHFILTAAHCAERLALYYKIAIPIRKGGRPLIIHRMLPVYVGRRDSDGSGPDLAFLPIHPVDAGDLKAKSDKVFYNLEKHKDEILPLKLRIENSLWAIVGTPSRLSNVSNPLELEFSLMAYAVGVERATITNGFDYINIRISLEGRNLLPTYKGLSGSGLWQAEIERKKDGSVALIGSRRLVGCAFYETDEQGEYFYIRCHGPRSIYELGLANVTESKSEGEQPLRSIGAV
jgi:hypothetical protein